MKKTRTGYNKSRETVLSKAKKA